MGVARTEVTLGKPVIVDAVARNSNAVIVAIACVFVIVIPNRVVYNVFNDIV